ncbi:hypothetical protein AB0M83_32960 [Amycolatopsis sp. NPDC051106]|uniref:hypothetical protein n=2 Tax=unclassified Amycolatopsis TaxID=2618356 RepID=UPI0034214919
MGKQQGRRIDRHTAEQVLRGARVDAPDALTGLLAAAAAPPRDGELGGERAAVTAFREAARHAHARRPRSPSMIKSRWAKLLTAKVAAAVGAVFVLGGVATAAVTGALPLPAGGSAPAPSTSRPAPSAAVPPATPATTWTRDESGPAHPPAPSPSLVGLCHAYRAGDKAEHGKALESPAFTALVTAAGDKSKVDGYCESLVEASPPPHATGSPAAPPSAGRPDNGKDHPAGPPDSHPAGPPDTRPTGPPATHPTGRPTR